MWTDKSKQMNFFQIFPALAFIAISFVDALKINKPTTDTFALGDVITLNVGLDLVNGDLQRTLTYTAVFSSSSGMYQMSGLAFDEDYSLIPPGAVGPTTLTLTATGCSTALLSLVINPSVPNSPPNFVQIPSLIFSQSLPVVYSHFDENGHAVIDGVAHFSNQEEALSCSKDPQCVETQIKKADH
jgi:hypothetical protein